MKLINLMNKLIILSFGEVIHLYKKYFIPEQEDKQNYEDSLLSKNKSFLFSNLINEKKNIIVVEKNKKENEEKAEKENDEIINHKNMLKEEYKNSFIEFYKYLHHNLEKYISLFDNINENYELLK